MTTPQGMNEKDMADALAQDVAQKAGVKAGATSITIEQAIRQMEYQQALAAKALSLMLIEVARGHAARAAASPDITMSAAKEALLNVREALFAANDADTLGDKAFVRGGGKP